jgi:hypothetical protein
MKIFILCSVILLASAGSVPAYGQQAEIEGSVRDLQGTPISGATVYAYNTARMTGRFIRLTTSSQSDGKFVIHDVAPGSYRVHAYKETDGYADTFFAFFGTNNKNAWRGVEVSKGHTTVVALVLGPKYGKLKVSIRNERDSPISGELSFRKVDDPASAYNLGVNADSEVLVPPVPFRFEVSAEGFRRWQSEILRPRPGETLKVTVHLTRSP